MLDRAGKNNVHWVSSAMLADIEEMQTYTKGERCHKMAGADQGSKSRVALARSDSGYHLRRAWPFDIPARIRSMPLMSNSPFDNKSWSAESGGAFEVENSGTSG